MSRGKQQQYIYGTRLSEARGNYRKFQVDGNKNGIPTLVRSEAADKAVRPGLLFSCRASTCISVEARNPPGSGRHRKS